MSRFELSAEDLGLEASDGLPSSTPSPPSSSSSSSSSSASSSSSSSSESGESGGENSSVPPAAPAAATPRRKPVVILVIGMAGSGKTAIMHRINLTVLEKGLRGYFVNLDPAVKTVPFAANIDIRDTVNYKEIMKQYGLGPNGAILTSLNLFATRFDQVIGLLEKRADSLDYIFIDTPGQIEAFTWSAGGMIIQELLAMSFPTTVLYVSDTIRCGSPTTFMSNMLYACSVLYKSRLPMIIAFNKIDIAPCAFAEEWMDDFESYMTALDHDSEEYMSSFNRSLNLVMDEFYKNIARIGLSAATGEGFDEIFGKFDASAEEFVNVYLPDLEKRVSQQQVRDKLRQEMELKRLRDDIRAHKGDKLVFDSKNPAGKGI